MKMKMMLSSAAAIIAATMATASLADSATSGTNAKPVGDAAMGATTNDAGASVSTDAATSTGALESTTSNSPSMAEPTPAPDQSTGGTKSTGTAAMADMDYDTMMEGMTAQADFSSQASGITADSEVTVVKLSELGEPSDDGEALDMAMEQEADAISTGRAAVSANADLNEMLTAAGYTADDVVSVQSAADGSVYVIVDDRA